MVKSHACPLCSKTFPHPYRLRDHLRAAGSHRQSEFPRECPDTNCSVVLAHRTEFVDHFIGCHLEVRRRQHFARRAKCPRFLESSVHDEESSEASAHDEESLSSSSGGEDDNGGHDDSASIADDFTTPEEMLIDAGEASHSGNRPVTGPFEWSALATCVRNAFDSRSEAEFYEALCQENWSNAQYVTHSRLARSIVQDVLDSCHPVRFPCPKLLTLPLDPRTARAKAQRAADVFCGIHKPFPEKDLAVLGLFGIILDWISTASILSEACRVSKISGPLWSEWMNHILENRTGTTPPLPISESILEHVSGRLDERWQCERFVQALAEHEESRKWILILQEARRTFPEGVEVVPFPLQTFFDGLPLNRRKSSAGYAAVVTPIALRVHFIPPQQRVALFSPFVLCRNESNDAETVAGSVVGEFKKIPAAFVLTGVPKQVCGSNVSNILVVPYYLSSVVDGVARNQVAGLKAFSLSRYPCTLCMYTANDDTVSHRWNSCVREPNVLRVFTQRLDGEKFLVEKLRNGSQGEKETVYSTLGYSYCSPLWELSKNMPSTLGVDLFHTEGENLIETHMSIVDKHLSTFSGDEQVSEFWQQFCKALKKFFREDGESSGTFSSFKSWRKGCTGYQKMWSFLYAPCALVEILPPGHSFFSGVAWESLLSHVRYLVILTRKFHIELDRQFVSEGGELEGTLWNAFRTSFRNDVMQNFYRGPTLHMAEHYTSVIRRLGLLSLNTAFPFERANKYIRRSAANTNNVGVCVTILSRMSLQRSAVLGKFSNLPTTVGDSDVGDRVVLEPCNFFLCTRVVPFVCVVLGGDRGEYVHIMVTEIDIQSRTLHGVICRIDSIRHPQLKVPKLSATEEEVHVPFDRWVGDAYCFRHNNIQWLWMYK